MNGQLYNLSLRKCNKDKKASHCKLQKIFLIQLVLLVNVMCQVDPINKSRLAVTMMSINIPEGLSAQALKRSAANL